MDSLFRPNEESSYILYIDATILYGEAMSHELPNGDVSWRSEDESFSDLET